MREGFEFLELNLINAPHCKNYSKDCRMYFKTSLLVKPEPIVVFWQLVIVINMSM